MRNRDALGVGNLRDRLAKTFLKRGAQREFVVIDEPQHGDSRKCFVDARDVEGVIDAHRRVVLEVRVSGCRGLNLPVSRLGQHRHAGIAEIDALLQQ